MTVPIATVNYAGPWEHTSEAVLTRLMITEHGGIHAHEPVVAQGLHYRNSAFSGSLIDRGRPKRKEILDVQKIELTAI